jgi:hypothetical protein
MRIRVVVGGLVALALVGGCAPKRKSVDTSRSPEAMFARATTEIEKGCAADLQNFCASVTPGEQRLLACLYAFNDQLSSPCEYALLDAAAQLQREVAELAYVANECDDDLERLCAGVAAGQGRLLQCLDQNAKKLGSRCTTALNQTDL